MCYNLCMVNKTGHWTDKEVGRLRDENAALSARVDELSEMIINAFDGALPGVAVQRELVERQVQHRKADLDRLLTCGKITDP